MNTNTKIVCSGDDSDLSLKLFTKYIEWLQMQINTD